jgi:REP element-mobilizing transposase RayT
MKQIYFEPGQLYHIYNRANGGEDIFPEPENYRYFLQKYQEKTTTVADTIAYCLMPNHFHLLVKIKEEKVLEAFIRKREAMTHKPVMPLHTPQEEKYHFIVRRTFHSFFSGYVKAFNKYHGRSGSLLQQNTKRKIVMDGNYLQNAITYIHCNPVKHEFTLKPEDWPYSSFHSYVDGESGHPLRQQVFDWFGGKQAFISAHSTHAR